MKVLHINTEKGWRGGERQTLFTLKGLNERGVWCGLIAAEGGPLAEKASEAGIRVFPLEMKGPADLISAYRIARLCKKEQVSVLHLQTSHACSLAAFSRIFGNKIPMIAARRVDFAIRSAWKYNRFDRVVPISRAIEKILIEGGVDKKRIRLIPSGVETRITNAENRERIRKELCGENDFLIGAIGHLTDHKGQSYLIAAMPAILAAIPSARLFIAGGGELRQKLEEQTRELGLADKVVFAGFREDAPELIPGFDLFVHPSKLEGLCTTILDVILRKVPVVASNAGGIPEATGDGRFATLVEPCNSQALAEAVVAVYKGGVLKEKLERGAIFVRENFSVDTMVDKTISLYRELQ